MVIGVSDAEQRAASLIVGFSLVVACVPWIRVSSSNAVTVTTVSDRSLCAGPERRAMARPDPMSMQVNRSLLSRILYQ